MKIISKNFLFCPIHEICSPRIKHPTVYKQVELINVISATSMCIYSVDTKLEKLKYLIQFKYYGKYLYLYLTTVLMKVFAIVFVFGKFIVIVFVYKCYAMYLDPSLNTEYKT